jgi:hypothetical protein
LLASGRSQTVDDKPDVQVIDPKTGQVVGKTLSAEKQIALMRQEIQAALGKEVKPLKDAHDKQVTAEKQREFTAEVERRTDAAWAKLEGRDGFKEYAPSIAKALEAHPDWTARDAYDHVYDTEIAPQREARIKAAYDTELKTKAAASSLNPSASRVTNATRPTSFTDPSLKWS